MSKHTPGPWEVRVRNTGDNIFSADNKRIADTFGPPDVPEFAANAKLIAAAPEMLTALKAALYAMTNQRYLLPRKDMETEHALVAAAIAKATGD